MKCLFASISCHFATNLFNRSKRTIEVHRARVMCKLGADSLVDLVKRNAAMGFVDLGASGETGTNPASAKDNRKRMQKKTQIDRENKRRIQG
jgi:hypothetical protein